MFLLRYTYPERPKISLLLQSNEIPSIDPFLEVAGAQRYGANGVIFSAINEVKRHKEPYLIEGPSENRYDVVTITAYG